MNPFHHPVARPRSPRAIRSASAVAPKPLTGVALPAGPRVICLWPPKELNPNARGFWARRSRAAKTYRADCCSLTLSAGLHRIDLDAVFGVDGPIGLRIDFFPPDRRRRDDDNAVASFKAGRDGIADALKVDDARFIARIVWRPEPLACVVVTLEAA